MTLTERITTIVRAIRKDKVLKWTLTSLCTVSFIMGIWYPYLIVHSAIVSYLTNMLWLWEA